MAAHARAWRRAKALALASSLALTLALGGACTPRLAPPGPGLAPGLVATDLAVPRLDETRFVTDDGLVLPMRAWQPLVEPPRAVILALHGFNDYSKAFERAGEYWSALGYAVYAYDQRGFGAAPHRGLWAGTAALTADLRAAARLLRARYPRVPLYLLGDSMGGAVILAASVKGEAGAGPLPADGVILVAPAVWARATMPVWYRAALWLGAHTLPWAKLSGRGLKIQASDNIEMLRALGRDPLVIKETRIDAIHGLVDLMDQALAAAPKFDPPALLLYGEKDEVVPEDPSLRLWQELSAAARGRQRRALYANGWHMLLRDLDARIVWQDIAGWIADPAAPLNSDAEARARARLSGDAS